jgi:histidyl-tRNA synthetase
MLKRVPGTKDILPDEVSRWQKIEETARSVFSCYNYREIRPPLIEQAALFNRSLGESTEVIQKQMFIIKKDEDELALRPEATASIVRAYIENNLDKTEGLVKYYYLGPMFRYERPQKGRLRQFHHLGCEVIGADEPASDVEVIELADHILKTLKITGYTIKLNSLGCQNDKAAFTQGLRTLLKNRESQLCADCQVRLNQNVLRILDCKNDACRAVIATIPTDHSYLCADCTAHFASVRRGLDLLSVSYTVSPHLVRGLDYYTRTVFEISHSGLGAQDALGAGGRYDTLVKDLGGPEVGAIGFAFGMERLLLVYDQTQDAQPNSLVYIISMNDAAQEWGMRLQMQLRKSGIPCDSNYQNKSLKGAMRHAAKLGARFVLLLGEDEVKKQVITVKDMNVGKQQELTEDMLAATLKTS